MIISYKFLFILFVIIIMYIYFKIDICNLYVQLSAASFSYFIYLPIVVKAWKICGYNSIVILVYHNFTKSISFIRNELRKLGSDVILLQLNTSLSLHYASKLARIYGFEVSKRTKRCDYMILSDADMIPLSKHFFNDKTYGKLTIKSFGPKGYGYGNNKGRWAMCYISANKFIWKDILKNEINGKSLNYIVSDLIKYLLQKGVKYFENFAYVDEVYMRDRIREWNLFKTNVLFHLRIYNNTRIDRSKWYSNFSFINKTNIIDIHLPKVNKLNKKLKSIWISNIIPLQKFIFKYTPYGVNYIENFIKFNN